jgi:hypothetical protein
MNARTHGLLAVDAVHPDFDSPDDCAQFDKLARRNHAWYHPLGPIEEILVDKITISVWRLKKAVRYEAACAVQEMHDDPPRVDPFGAYLSPGPSNLQRTIKEELKYQPKMAGADDELRAIIPLSHQTALLLRYEGAANREMYRAMAELRRMRKEGAEREHWTEPATAREASQRAAHREKYETKPNPELAAQAQEFSRDRSGTTGAADRDGSDPGSLDSRSARSG